MEKYKNILPRDAALSDVKNNLDGAKQGDLDRPKATQGSKGKSWGLKQPLSLIAWVDDPEGWKGKMWVITVPALEVWELNSM